MAPAKLLHMTHRISATAHHSLLWKVAVELSLTSAPIRRATGPHRGWAVAGVVIAAVGVAALVSGSVFPQQCLAFWRYTLLFVGITASIGGTYVAVWAGTETSVRLFNKRDCPRFGCSY